MKFEKICHDRNRKPCFRSIIFYIIWIFAVKISVIERSYKLCQEREKIFISVKMAGGKEDILKDTIQTTKQFMDIFMRNHIEK